MDCAETDSLGVGRDESIELVAFPVHGSAGADVPLAVESHYRGVIHSPPDSRPSMIHSRGLDVSAQVDALARYVLDREKRRRDAEGRAFRERGCSGLLGSQAQRGGVGWMVRYDKIVNSLNRDLDTSRAESGEFHAALSGFVELTHP